MGTLARRTTAAVPGRICASSQLSRLLPARQENQIQAEATTQPQKDSFDPTVKQPAKLLCILRSYAFRSSTKFNWPLRHYVWFERSDLLLLSRGASVRIPCRSVNSTSIPAVCASQTPAKPSKVSSLWRLSSQLMKLPSEFMPRIHQRFAMRTIRRSRLRIIARARA
jgi:hypothetical protein